MLKRVSLIITMILAVSSLFASNGSDLKVSLQVSSNNELTLSYNDFTETVVVRIFDNNGTVVYKEVYNSKGTNRELCDYSVLTPGKYVLNIKTRNDEITRMIFINDSYQISYKD